MFKPLIYILISLLTLSNLYAGRTVQLKKTVHVSGHLVLLKDLIVDTTKLKPAEKDLIIMKAPLRGFKNFTPVQIAYEMQNHQSLMDLSLMAPSFVKIIRVKDVNYVENVKEGLTKALKQENPWKRFNIEVEFTPEDINKINTMSGADFELISQRPSEALDSVKLSVKFSENDKNRGTVILKPLIRRKIFSITLKRDLNKGQIIKKSDLVVDQVWVDGKEDRYASNFIDCVGYEATKNLVAGSRVPKAYLADPVYVKKGEIIKVYVQIRTLKVGIHAKALTDGRRGETIRAKNTKSGKNLDVVMTAPQVAVVK